MKQRDHVNVISVRFNAKVPEKEKVVIVPKKSCNEEAWEVSTNPKSKEVEISKKGINRKPTVVAYKPKILCPTAIVRDRSKDEMRKLVPNSQIDRALADLGTSINVMSSAMSKKLDLGNPTLVRMSISLVDRSVRHLKVVLEDVFDKGQGPCLSCRLCYLQNGKGCRLPLNFKAPLYVYFEGIDRFGKKGRNQVTMTKDLEGIEREKSLMKWVPIWCIKKGQVKRTSDSHVHENDFKKLLETRRHTGGGTEETGTSRSGKKLAFVLLRSRMGKIDTKPIESVQAAISFCPENDQRRDKSMNKDELEKENELENILKELANIKVQLEAKDPAQKRTSSSA
ncbi:hypothetical protein M9H77_13057 [Catharanthus roseus]|uniref:Uncharacterized protein n=1 Tax=Catharanthus roseus TaxID=4058 RepID=A0ACC0BJA1_CATRO|nr:hypothetical protein M9H77_13057 [Catharanthus roseus]